MRWLVAAGTAALACAAFVAASTRDAPAAGGVPPGWMGVVVNDNTLLQNATTFASEARLMRSSGVQTIRIPVYWARMQPERGPIDYGDMDRLMFTAAQDRLRVLPSVLSSPPWAAVHPNNPTSSPPRDNDDYAGFVAALVKRYGTNGAFWAAHPKIPKLPIQIWQIWNEPSINGFWTVRPFAASYVALLKAAHDAIKQVDPTAKIMLAGLPNRSWDSLQELYTAGAKPYFDIAAVHPYTHSPPGVLHIVSIFRRTMAQNGDAKKPVSLTELGWSSDYHGVPKGVTWDTSEAGQAENLTHVFAALGAQRAKLNIQSAFWFDWYSPEFGIPPTTWNNWENFSGLRHGRGTQITSKPALAAYAKVAHQLEH